MFFMLASGSGVISFLIKIGLIALLITPFNVLSNVIDQCTVLRYFRNPSVFPLVNLSIKNGYSLDEISFQVSKVENGGFKFSLKYKNSEIGRLLTWKADKGDVDAHQMTDSLDPFFSVDVAMVEEFHGKGMGSILYLAAAAYLEIHFKKPLVTASAHSPDANKVWERLYNAHVATKFLDEATNTMFKSRGVDANYTYYAIQRDPLFSYAGPTILDFVKKMPKPAHLESPQ